VVCSNWSKKRTRRKVNCKAEDLKIEESPRIPFVAEKIYSSTNIMHKEVFNDIPLHLNKPILVL